MQLVEDDDARSPAFQQFEGRRAMMMRWTDPSPREAVQNLYDARWVFTEEAHAHSFLAHRVADLVKEGFPRVEDVPTLGDESAMFTSGRLHPEDQPLGSYAILFRLGRVVAGVKLVSGFKAPPGALTSRRAVEVARAAQARVARAR
jgi:hypothetical protein